jgi:hypothetical protein
VREGREMMIDRGEGGRGNRVRKKRKRSKIK